MLDTIVVPWIIALLTLAVWAGYRLGVRARFKTEHKYSRFLWDMAFGLATGLLFCCLTGMIVVGCQR